MKDKKCLEEMKIKTKKSKESPLDSLKKTKPYSIVTKNVWRDFFRKNR